MLGFPPRGLHGRPIDSVLPMSRQARAQHLREAPRHSLPPPNGEPPPVSRPMGSRRTLGAIRADGERLAVDVSFGVLDWNGEPALLAVLRDATAWKAAEAEARLRSVALEVVANSVAITDREGRFVWVNPGFTQLTGWTLGEVLGRDEDVLRPPNQASHAGARARSTLLRGEVWRGEVVTARKDGTTFVADVTLSPVEGEGGELSHFVAVGQDVTARREAEDALLARVHELGVLHELACLGSESSRSVTALVDSATHIVRSSLGLGDFEIRLFEPTVGPRASPRARPLFPSQPPQATPGDVTELPLRSASRLIGSLRATLPIDPERTDALSRLLVTIAGQLGAVVERAWLVEELQRQATTDALTGALNRRGLMATLEHEIGRARRYGHPLSVVLFDVDHFKRINDTRGHLAGDAVLAGLAWLIRRSLRSHDELGRYGGEELLLVLPETDLGRAHSVAERLRANIEEMGWPEVGPDLTVTVSAGVASLDDGALTTSELLQRADDALYAAKRSGRNRVLSWDPAVRSGEG